MLNADWKVTLIKPALHCPFSHLSHRKQSKFPFLIWKSSCTVTGFWVPGILLARKHSNHRCIKIPACTIGHAARTEVWTAGPGTCGWDFEREHEEYVFPLKPARRGATRVPQRPAAAAAPTCMALTVSRRCSLPSRTSSGRRTEALGSGKRENLSPTSNSLKRSRAFSFTLFLEANRKQRRDTPRPHPGPQHPAGTAGGVLPQSRPQRLPQWRGRWHTAPPSPPQGPGRSLLSAAWLPSGGRRGSTQEPLRKGQGGPLPFQLTLPLRSRHLWHSPTRERTLPFPFASRPPLWPTAGASNQHARSPCSAFWLAAGGPGGGGALAAGPSRRGCARRSRRRGGAEGRGDAGRATRPRSLPRAASQGQRGVGDNFPGLRWPREGRR